MFREANIETTINRPYDLRAGMAGSEDFYKKLSETTSVVIERAKQELGSLIDNYANPVEAEGSREKALLDMLITGVLWNEYAGTVCRAIALKSRLIDMLFRLRKITRLKKEVDRLRGKLAFRWLSGQKGNPPARNLKILKRLEYYLAATCEYREELKRISLLRKFLGRMQSKQSTEALRQITAFAAWFKHYTENELHPYTRGLNDFLIDHKQNYRGREDYFLTGRRQVEYHLNMVGAEILNRTLRKDFRKTKQQVLLLPACMASGMNCQAQQSGNNLLCMHCTSSCPVSGCSLEMEKRGIKTVLIRHSSDFSKWLKPWANQKETGLIGVACVLNLLLGGFEMMRLGIPSQCVFLDFPACKKHWLKGTPSGICRNQVCNLCDKEQNKYAEILN